MMTPPLQTIFFGSPGTGKSHYVKTQILPALGINSSNSGGNYIPTVFHPEYTYGDFMGKLLPRSYGGNVEYRYHAGHFLKALAQAYKNLLSGQPSNVVLSIDEINRGNSAAIFGTIFQLLDREDNGWSSYQVTISNMELDTLLEEMGAEVKPIYDAGGKVTERTYVYKGKKYHDDDIAEVLAPLGLEKYQIKIPGNLSIIATMNTSDNSIYYMDTAFKRRWDWQYVNNNSTPVSAVGVAFYDRDTWNVFVDKLNKFIRSHHKYVRRVEDKQIGHWFITTQTVSMAQVQNKIMFYIWDSVFGSNRKPLADLLKVSSDSLITFGDFSEQVEDFIKNINNY